jgi:hypothetical protein
MPGFADRSSVTIHARAASAASPNGPDSGPKGAVSSDQRNISFGRDDLAREVADEQAARMEMVDQGRTDRDSSPGGNR